MKLKGLVFLFLCVNATRAMHITVSPDSLFKAVKAQDILQVRMILQSLTESNSKTVLEWQSKPEVRTALMQCCIDKNFHIASLLVSAGANMFATDFTGTSPLSYATDMNHRNVELVEIFLKTPHEPFQKKIEWRLLNDLLNEDSSFSLEQNCRLVETLLSIRPNLLCYQWLKGLAAKSTLACSDIVLKKNYLPIYKAIAPALLVHNKNYHKREGQKIVCEMNDVHKPTTFMSTLPLELKNLVVEAYSESRIISNRRDYELIMSCPD